MAKQTLNTIKNWFKTGLKPTQQQFWDTWDSFWHKDQIIPTSSIENLDSRFDEKADAEALASHIADMDAHGAGGTGITLGTGSPVDAGTIVGETYLDTNNGNIWKWDGTVWNNNGSLYPGITKIGFGDLTEGLTYANPILAGRTFQVFNNTIGRFYTEAEVIINTEGGFVLTDPITDGEFLFIIGNILGVSGSSGGGGDLQATTNLGNITNKTIQAAPAVLDEEMVNLQQLKSRFPIENIYTIVLPITYTTNIVDNGNGLPCTILVKQNSVGLGTMEIDCYIEDVNVINVVDTCVIFIPTVMFVGYLPEDGYSGGPIAGLWGFGNLDGSTENVSVEGRGDNKITLSFNKPDNMSSKVLQFTCKILYSSNN